MNQIELYERLQNPIEAIDRIGEMFAKSGMFGCDRVEQGKVLALVCLAERKSPVEITRNYDIVDGKLRKKALAALADFRRAGGRQRWIKTGDEPTANDDDREAVGEFTFDGNSMTVRFSMRDARRQGLMRDKSGWAKTPGNMLRARVASNAVAMLAPEIFAGDDSPAETAAAAPLLQVNESPVIEVASEPVAPPAVETLEQLAAENVAATAAPAQPAAPPPAVDNEAVQRVRRLEVAIGEAHAEKALAWLKAKRWITNSLADLSAENAERILAKPGQFLKHIGA